MSPTSFRRVGRDVLIYGGGDVLLRATSFVTLPIYTRILTPSDYGAMSLVLTVSSFLTAFLVLGGDSAYMRLFFEAKTEERKVAVTSTACAFLGVWALGIVAVLAPFSPLYAEWLLHSRDDAVLFVLALVTGPVVLLSGLLGQVLRNEFRPVLYSVFSLVTAALTVGASLVGVVVLDWGVAGILAGSLAASAVLLPFRAYAARRYLRPRFDRQILRGLLAFGLPLVPSSLAWWIFDLSDRVILSRLADLKDVGLYALAFSIASVLALAVGGLAQAWSPHAYRLYEEDPDAAPAFFGRMLTYVLVGVGTICVAATTLAHPLLTLLATKPFYGAADAVGPLALSFVAYATIQVTALGISLTKKTRYVAYFTWLSALANVGLNLALVPHFGMMAAAWSTFAAYLLLTLGFGWTTQRLAPIAYEARKAAAACALILAFTIGFRFLPNFDRAAGFGIAAVYTLGFVGALAATGVLDVAEVRRVTATLRRREPAPVA